MQFRVTKRSGLSITSFLGTRKCRGVLVKEVMMETLKKSKKMLLDAVIEAWDQYKMGLAFVEDEDYEMSGWEQMTDDCMMELLDEVDPIN